MKKHNTDYDEKSLLKILATNEKTWGLDFYEKNTKTDLVNALKQNHLQSLEIIDYLEDHVIPFLDEYDCSEEKLALKKWVSKTRGTIEKQRLTHRPHDDNLNYKLNSFDDY